MSNVLALAADFIERMANPGYGIRVNEDYAMRFGSLLETKDLEELLRKEISTITNPESLSPHGWLWILGWARSRGIRLDEKLLLRLVELSSDVFMQVVVIDIATRHIEWQRQPAVVSIGEFDNVWLSTLLGKCTKVLDRGDEYGWHIDTRRSESILVALMQVGSEIALDGASTLLNHKWPGQRRIVEWFMSLCGEMELETRANWIDRLQPPNLGNI